MIYVIKRLVYSICLIYSTNIFITGFGKYIPINEYSVIIIYIYGFLGILMIIYLKYYI